MEVKEIDLLDLRNEILRHWKWLIICMIIGAITFTLFDYIKNSHQWYEARKETEKEYNDSQITDELVAITKASMELKDTEETLVLMLMDDEKELEEREKYNNNSIIMDMDPYNIPRVELIYELSQLNADENHILGNIYQDVLSGVGLYDFIEKQTKINSISAKELVSISVRNNKDYTDENEKLILGNDSLKVVLIHADEKECLKLAEAFKKYIDNIYQEMCLTIGEHKLKLISENTGFIMDTNILDRQISNRNVYLTLQNSIAKTKDGFTNEQEYLYNLLNGLDNENIKLKPEISLKMCVFGSLILAFIYCAVLTGLYVMNNKIRSVNRFNIIYDITHFGVIEPDNKGIELVIASLKLCLIKERIKEVYLVTCYEDDAIKEACECLKQNYENEGIKVQVLVDIMNNAKSMECLTMVENAVLIEKAGKAHYSNINEEIDLLKRQDIKILGGIIVA